jgi:hypothetical protein
MSQMIRDGPFQPRLLVLRPTDGVAIISNHCH